MSCCFRPRARVFFSLPPAPPSPTPPRPTELSGLPAAGFPHFRSQEVRAPLRGFAKLRAAGRSTWRSYPLARARWSGPVASRHAVPAVRFDFLPRLAPVSASARDMVPPHTIAGIISSLCATSAAAALKPSLIAARSPLSMHSLRPVRPRRQPATQPHEAPVLDQRGPRELRAHIPCSQPASQPQTYR